MLVCIYNMHFGVNFDSVHMICRGNIVAQIEYIDFFTVGRHPLP